jgi:GTP-binding protein Era
MPDATVEEGAHRGGFVCFVGRPNAGKSTLVNALVGAKVAITADQPQTTRRAIRGIVRRGDAEVVIVDTPGLHRPRTLLGERLNDLVRSTLAEVDGVGLCLPADERIGPGDRMIAGELAALAAPTVAIVTKADLVSRAALAARLLEVESLGEWREIVPVSAVSGENLETLVDVFVGLLPSSPPLFPVGMSTDEPEDARIAELIREAALAGAREELPHSIAVVVDEVLRPDGDAGGVVRIAASLVVERESQKGIVIGKGGARLKDAGTRARVEIERMLGARVALDLRVRVAKDWQRDPKQLGRLGF